MPGPGVCPRCFDLTPIRVGLCANCACRPNQIDAFVPVSYSVGGESLHHDLAAYKRAADPSVPQTAQRIGGLLARFLHEHERCLAAHAGIAGFDVVTTVPSGSNLAARDRVHPLRELVAAIPQLQDHYRRVLYPGLHRGRTRSFDQLRYFAFADLHDLSVLLIDDLWTTGSSAQSAAAALRACGARTVAVVTVGRHLKRTWATNDLRLRQLAGNFSWERCTLCAEKEGPVTG